MQSVIVNNVFWVLFNSSSSIFIYIVCKKDSLISLHFPIINTSLGSGTTNVDQRILERIFPSCDNARFHESDINQPDDDAAGTPHYYLTTDNELQCYYS